MVGIQVTLIWLYEYQQETLSVISLSTEILGAMMKVVPLDTLTNLGLRKPKNKQEGETNLCLN